MLRIDSFYADEYIEFIKSRPKHEQVEFYISAIDRRIEKLMNEWDQHTMQAKIYNNQAMTKLKERTDDGFDKYLKLADDYDREMRIADQLMVSMREMNDLHKRIRRGDYTDIELISGIENY